MKKTKDEVLKEFEEFDLKLDYSIDFLLQLASTNSDKYLPLDYSIKSLNRLEDLYEDYLNEIVGKEVSNTDMVNWIAAYMGICLVKEFGGGIWEVELDEKLINYGLPGIYKIPGLAESYGWCPYIAIRNFGMNRRNGIFTSSIMSHHEWINK